MPAYDQQSLQALYDVVARLARRVGHDLRNPLSMIAQAVYVLKMQLAEGDPDAADTVQIIDVALDNAENLLNGLNDYVVFAPPEYVAYHIQMLLDTAIAHTGMADNINININYEPSLPEVKIDVDQMLVAMRVVLDYCARAMPQGGEINIAIQADAQVLRMTIVHTGKPIDQLAAANLLNPFATEGRYGTGLELPLAKLLIEGQYGILHTGDGQHWTIDLPIHRHYD